MIVVTAASDDSIQWYHNWDSASHSRRVTTYLIVLSTPYQGYRIIKRIIWRWEGMLQTNKVNISKYWKRHKIIICPHIYFTLPSYQAINIVDPSHTITNI